MLVLVLVSSVEKNVFPHVVHLLWPKRQKTHFFKELKSIKQTQTISEMFHGGPWFLESSFLEMKKRWVGNKNAQYLFCITRGLRAIWSTTDHIRPLISSTSQLSETSLTEEFGDLKQSPLFDGPLWKTSPLYLHYGTQVIWGLGITLCVL